MMRRIPNTFDAFVNSACSRPPVHGRRFSNQWTAEIFIKITLKSIKI